MTDISNSLNPEPMKITVPVDDLGHVLQLAECGSDDRAEYLFGPHAEEDLGDDLSEERAALEVQQRAMAALNEAIATIRDRAGTERSCQGSGLPLPEEQEYTVTLQLPDYLPGAGGGDTLLWFGCASGRNWAEAAARVQNEACEKLGGIDHADDLKILSAFPGRHEDVIEQNTSKAGSSHE
ncbi:hypothetical protein TK90_2722 (plasmid) [Thioalkalivibrio sp. K90mix]|uniref:hypothetical protein n=1 Tax=Thioalkalivibrio sp. (strain K90mix) TaxID=396595 RepID=UPI000195A4D9|nr:hypothetical protein [Thioalkalivibrio sp. K90mix]ADC73208.1 hypothetical protein TK90_2722 [Thioalkalivibrio sp. K90mix]